MGSSCACPSNQPPITPRPHCKENSSRQIKTPSDIKFADINPVEVLDIKDSEYDLNFLANQIVSCLDEYEKDHGVISRRLRLERSDFQSERIGKVSFSSSIQSSCSRKQQKKSGQSALCLQFNNQDREINLNQGQISESFSSEVLNQKQQSCMLSQRSHILQSSIFTDRLEVRQKFYAKFTRFDGTELLPWPEQRRQSYVIEEEQLKIEVNKKYHLKMIVLLRSIKNYFESNSIHLLSYCQQPLGLKLHFNGRKRMLPISGPIQSRIPLDCLVGRLSALNQDYEIGQIAFIVTGWIPEELRMSEIRSFQGIFERLSGNIEEGNILVFFSRREKKSIDYATLTKIDLENGLISINSCGNSSLIPSDFLVQPRSPGGDQLLRLQDFVMLIDVIHLSWNPTIYDFCISRESLLTKNTSINRYKLVIPPSSQDIQIRMFVQAHHETTSSHHDCNLVIKLFQFQSMGSVEGTDPIRVVEVDKVVFSDVFIFQSCKEKSEYVITVESGSEREGSQDIYSTITLYSFVQMYFNEIQSNPVLKELSVQAKITAQNMGFGINSPYFTKNLQFQIETEPNRELTISVSASQALSYEICLIPNPENRKILTQLHLQSIISDSLVSHQKHGTGSFTIQTTSSHYILVINSFSSYEGYLKIACQMRGKPFSSITPVLSLKKIVTNNTIIFFQQIKWLPSHFGPRKRLKSNSNNHFQPVEVFNDFFRNPCIEKELQKGSYQFFVRSETFKEYFDSVEQNEKNECEPPALSMSVLEASSDKKEYKIIVDDAYYVPFGIGFWTQVVDLQHAIYRFIFPKMEKSFAVGIFGIVKC